jgi:peptidoglycan/LPS O-acetylase OafA/YrhL
MSQIISKKNNWLEVIRGTAAFAVVLNHSSQLSKSLDNNIFVNAICVWGSEAVVVFFVLSGVVIRLVDDKNPTSAPAFILNRLKRIVPIFFICSLLALIVDTFLFKYNYTLNDILLKFFFCSTLQGWLSATFESNQPMWSLSFEMFFYALFAFGLFFKNKVWMYVWSFLSLASLALKYFYLSTTPIQTQYITFLQHSSGWLLGYFVIDITKNLKFTYKQSLAIVAMIPMLMRLHIANDYYDPFLHLLMAILTVPLFSRILNKNINASNNFSNIILWLIYLILVVVHIYFTKSTKISSALYVVFPLLVYFGFTILKSFIKLYEPIGIFLGKISYGLYLSHFMVAILIGVLDLHVVIKILLFLPISIGLAYLLETYYQKNILRWLS